MGLSHNKAAGVKIRSAMSARKIMALPRSPNVRFAGKVDKLITKKPAERITLVSTMAPAE